MKEWEEGRERERERPMLNDREGGGGGLEKMRDKIGRRLSTFSARRDLLVLFKDIRIILTIRVYIRSINSPISIWSEKNTKLSHRVLMM